MPESHPIQERPDWTDRRRIQWLEIHLAMLWDEVWWHQLPFWKRWYYWLCGFRSPLTEFYREDQS